MTGGKGAEGFDAEYLRCLAEHLAGGHDAESARQLGRRALADDLTVLDLLAAHRRARRELLGGLDRLDVADAFLSETMAAHEVAQRANADAHRAVVHAQQRVDLLRGLSDAYLAIAGGPTLDERLQQVCIQAQEFLGAEDARLEFGRHGPVEGDEAEGLDEMAAQLDGSGGRLILRAQRGRTWTAVERQTLEQLALLISAPIDDARRLDFTQRLERLGALIATASDQKAILDRLLQDGMTGMDADDAALWLVDGGTTQLVTSGDTKPERSALLADVGETGETVFLNATAAIADHLGRGDSDGITDGAAAVVPLGAGERCLGAIGFWYDLPQPFDPVQRSFILRLANRVVAVLERGRAYEGERLARRDAELASRRFQALQELAGELSRAATSRRVAQVLLLRAMRWSDALGGVVATAVGGQPFEVLAQSGRIDAADGVTEALSDEILRQLRAHGTTAGAADLSDDLQARLEASGVRSLAVYPIIAGRRSIGVMVLGWAEPYAAYVLDELLRAQVAMAGPALARAERYDLEHDIADTLQRSILALPHVDQPGVRWSAYYQSGSAGLAGGDWYDLYALDEHRLAITVGDIVGRGVQAAAAMGQLRSAARAMARLVEDPGALLGALDEFTATTGQGRYSSMAYLVVDTLHGELQYSIAGHPPPVLRTPDGAVELLQTEGAPLLGITCNRATVRRPLAPGSWLVVYTDGLIERRAEGLDVGLARIVTAVRSSAGQVDPDTFCASLASQLRQPDAAADDVAIVTVSLLT